jgi:hypothetical protein
VVCQEGPHVEVHLLVASHHEEDVMSGQLDDEFLVAAQD